MRGKTIVVLENEIASLPHPDARFPSKGGKVAAARRERGRIEAHVSSAHQRKTHQRKKSASLSENGRDKPGHDEWMDVAELAITSSRPSR
jgi:hypothetical protein